MIVAVTSTPFKCPPAPSETALLMHDFLSARGLRERSEIDLVMPLPVPIPPSPDASKALLAAFAERGIGWHPSTLVRGLDPARRVALLGDDTEIAYDLFLGVPKHRVPPVVEASGLTVDGWIPVESRHARDVGSRRLCRGRRDERGNPEGRRVRRGPSRSGRRPNRRADPG